MLQSALPIALSRGRDSFSHARYRSADELKLIDMHAQYTNAELASKFNDELR
jgi:hypothetical protein